MGVRGLSHLIQIALIMAVVLNVLPCSAAALSEAEVQKLATQYRDQWVVANQPEGASWLAQGRIASVQQAPNGWHVVFKTKTGDDPRTPEGLHIYYLHICLKGSGELDKIVRGPDVVS